MQLLRYGQPLGGITQVSFVVQDLDEAMDEYRRDLSVGPWHVSPVLHNKEAEYRGAMSDFRLRLALVNRAVRYRSSVHNVLR